MTELYGKVLIVDDDPTARLFYGNLLKKAGFAIITCADIESMFCHIEKNSLDAILLDMHLGTHNSLDILENLLTAKPQIRIYFLTAHGKIDDAVTAMKNGACRYFQKSDDPNQIINELKRIVPYQSLPTPTPDPDNLRQLGIIGVSEAWNATIRTIMRLGNVNSNVLILGESGTGKELLAKALHNISPRRQGRFAAINCSAIPESLLESELFGHKRGSFTDAKTDRKGIFELCSGGTLLLDEIGDMPLNLQTKLLRVIQEMEVTPVGSSTPVKIDTRVISATHRDINKLIAQNLFRDDLFYRIAVVVLRVPALRERLGDIELLTKHFIDEFSHKFHRSFEPLTPSQLRQFENYSWPGNVRELRHAIERAVVLSENKHLSIEDIFSHITKKTIGVLEDISTGDETPYFRNIFDLPLTKAKHAFEKRYLENLIGRHQGNIRDVATKSGRYTADIYRLLARYKIDFSKH